MVTIIVFILTLAELLAVALGYLVPFPILFEALVTYGSPVFFILNLLRENPVALGQYLLFPLTSLFHVVKYICLCISQADEDRHYLHFLAVIFELVYLAICIYHLKIL